MSNIFGLTPTRLTIYLIGIILLALGGSVVYFASTIQGHNSYWFMTPIGLIVAVLGILLLVSKGD